jgi:hypothetical protein
MDQDMDLTIGSLNFHVRYLGSIRLLDLVKPGPLASKSKTVAMSESSEGSSSKVNSPVSFAATEIAEGKIGEGNETIENFDLEVQLEDLMICHDDTSDKSTNTWKTGLELHEDDNSIFSSFNSKLNNRYQVLAIIGDNSEELDENNNLVLNPANVNRGANHLVEGETADSLASREKVRLSVEEWRIIKTAVEHGTPIPTEASKNMLLGYHYALRQQSKQLAKERIKIQKEETQPLQQVKLITEHAAMHHTQTTEGIIDMDQGSKTSSTKKGKASPRTLTRLSYRSTSKGTLYQRHQKQHL